MDFQNLIAKTKKVNEQFSADYKPKDRMLDLVEEVGELAQAMLIVSQTKKTNDPAKQRNLSDIADALADILYDLIILADDYKIDLDHEYADMLDRLQTRINIGEFA